MTQTVHTGKPINLDAGGYVKLAGKLEAPIVEREASTSEEEEEVREKERGERWITGMRGGFEGEMELGEGMETDTCQLWIRDRFCLFGDFVFIIVGLFSVGLSEKVSDVGILIHC